LPPNFSSHLDSLNGYDRVDDAFDFDVLLLKNDSRSDVTCAPFASALVCPLPEYTFSTAFPNDLLSFRSYRHGL
jgi:hypothetical protein